MESIVRGVFIQKNGLYPSDIFDRIEYVFAGSTMITLEDARILESLSKNASIAKTAKELGKSNSTVVYALDLIEDKTALRLFNRTGYRTTLSEKGVRLLEASRKMLASEAEFSALCSSMKSGWESDLKIIVEGVVELGPILRVVSKLVRQELSTRFHVRAEFLSRVEAKFTESKADLMISVLPPQIEILESIPLEEIPATLVVHRDHSLLRERKIEQVEDLKRYPLLTVRGSDPRLNMSTAFIEPHSTIELNDFHTKKIALLEVIGFGWMPHYLIQRELERGILKPIKWPGRNTHLFRPYLYHRGTKRLGKAGRLFIEMLCSNSKPNL